MLFSIIIPAYNCEQYLEASVDSVLSQEFRDWEIVLVDDGSTDSTPEICDTLVSHGNIRVLHNSNQGASAARNAGIDVARGRYIVFLDADDMFGPGYLQGIADIISSHPVDLLMGSTRTDFGEGTSPHDVTLFDAGYANRLDTGKLLKYFFGPADDAPFATWHNIYAKDFLDRASLRFDTELVWSEDRDFILRTLASQPSFRCIAVKGYQHRVSVKTSVTGRITSEKILRAMTADEQWMDIALREPLFECSKAFFAGDYIYLVRQSQILDIRSRERVMQHALKHPECFSHVPGGKQFYRMMKHGFRGKVLLLVGKLDGMAARVQRKMMLVG